MFSPWLVALVAVALFAPPTAAIGLPGQRKAIGLGYRGRDACPARCSIAGPNHSNWSVYHNLNQVQACPQAVFYQFSLYDAVEDSDNLHRIYACSSYGPDWTNLPPNSTNEVVHAETTNVTYEIGWSGDGTLASSDIRTLLKQIRQYLANGYAATNQTVTLLAQVGKGSVGLYIGQKLQNEGLSAFALRALENSISDLDASNAGSLAMQLCEPGTDGDHVFGFMATSNGTFTPVQRALQSWSNATCLSFPHSKNVTGPGFFTTPLVSINNATNSTMGNTNSTSSSWLKRSGAGRLSPRADCTTVQVQSGDSCASLAAKCGISGPTFTSYNPSPTLCSTLQPLQHVCCSAGTLPNFAPKPNPDGSCATYTVQAGDFCAAMAAANSITIDQLTQYNAHTWAWNGCTNIWVGTVICLSSGTPPMPAAVANAVCGPQVPGTAKPASGVDISTLNPCPLNACCDVWGQCGTTAEFCTNTSTGAPGTAAPGTNGCISNCGTNIVRSAAPAVFRNIAYFEGFSLSRPCLYQDATQIDASQYTHLHYAFGTLTADYQVQISDVLSTYEFEKFKNIVGPARILSFGGWDFSTNPSTYNIFRQGVTAANRLTLATNIANFIKANNLDGVDIDWEYPGAPDIPGIPAADPNDGVNYLAFLVILKNLLPGKSVSIAAPSSYWYLRGYPIAQMSKVVDYIVFMTYDLHGQFDAGNQWSQDGCPTGRCLRSDVNLTETISALVLITKAGVPSNQVVVGVTSYGRSFGMAQAGCYTENCFFTGTATQSNAAKGPCTGTAGYISDAEINDIINSGRVNQNYIDGKSNTNILVYDDIQWVGWMSPSVKATRKSLYQSLSMGGTSDWASDLETYHDVPSVSASWSNFIVDIKAGLDPAYDGDRTGNWTSVQCDDPAVAGIRHYTPSQRWSMMDGSNAWSDVVNVWKQLDYGRGWTFSESVSATVKGYDLTDCGTLLNTNNCEQTVQCTVGIGWGAAGYEIWNSMVYIHEMYASYDSALFKAAAGAIDPALQDFENKFAPVPPPQDNTWLQILLDLIGMGAVMIAAPFFSFYLAELPFFVALGATETAEAVSDTVRDATYAIIATGVSIAKDLTQSAGGSSGPWTPEKQAEFSNYMGQVINAWGNVTSGALKSLFNGSDDTLVTLTSLIANGQFVEGATGTSSAVYPATTEDTLTDTQLENSIAKAFFGYAIPALWSVSGVAAFVMDSGFPCGTVDPVSQYLDADTMHSTWGCYDGKLYYLAYPDGNSQSCSDECTDSLFSAPPGLDSLDGNNFGGITLNDLITGSVRTYINNGNTNGGNVVDPSVKSTFDDLYNQDVTTPGYIRIPVCSPAMAFAAWDQVNGPSTGTPGYPCIPAMGINDCGDSTFVDQTSDASPTVEDCLGIVNNIQGTAGDWEVENALGDQHQLVGFGSCNFGVQGDGKNGNIDFHVGAQDIVDIINTSIQKFGGSGKVGSKGEMSCKGTVKGQNVNWGLY
ncbi:hypothetical protein QBC46DRAFT_300262 [Diplogelasinospora grovesii]|uniref:chitinase n=1 Tax=Diplogelasinospora grovesii TaxID=303347 RepID=A0AAN6RYT1_9PEZI|nr:hypothetical protein QBC46DRAFT_300262 [Diplogelasinospora grovesii]